MKTNPTAKHFSAFPCVSMAVGLLIGFSSSAASDDEVRERDRDADRAELLRLNTRLAQSQIVERDGEFFSSVAVEQFRVLAPGGLIEDRQQVLSGLTAWNATSVTLTNTQVVFHRDVASVMGRMDIDGEMKPVGRWGPLKYMSTWVLEEGEWKLLSRSLTPCLERLIEMGRC